MYVANAYKRTQRSKSDDSPVTAGSSGRVPRVGVNKSDLEAQGTEHGWTARPLTYNEVTEMPSSELHWHEQFNKENLDKALALPEKNRAYDAAVAQGQALRFWANAINRSPEECKALTADFKNFVETYPQYRSTNHKQENMDVLMGWLQDRHLYPIYSNLCLAFEACALAGKLWLNPSAIAVGSETEVIGTQHHNFHLLIQPQRRNNDDDISADAYLAQHDELKDKRTPPLIAARETRANATAAHIQQAAANTARSGSMTVTDYPDGQSGYPSAPTKYSFRRLLDSLSAAEYNKRLNEDPAFATAVDRLNGGNK
jgi:hypothetical protein